MKEFLRKLRKLTSNFANQDDFSKKIDVSQSMVSAWMRGKNSPSRRTLIRIAKVFKIPVEMLTDDSIELVLPPDAQVHQNPPEAPEIERPAGSERRIDVIENKLQELRAEVQDLRAEAKIQNQLIIRLLDEIANLRASSASPVPVSAPTSTSPLPQNPFETAARQPTYSSKDASQSQRSFEGTKNCSTSRVMEATL